MVPPCAEVQLHREVLVELSVDEYVLFSSVTTSASLLIEFELWSLHRNLLLVDTGGLFTCSILGGFSEEQLFERLVYTLQYYRGRL